MYSVAGFVAIFTLALVLYIVAWWFFGGEGE